jgi:hypothetical protein
MDDMQPEISIYANGHKYWYQHGKRHRDDGPARIDEYGNKFWCQHGKYHRDDGPAVIDADGNKFWHQHGELHRDDGPAVIYANGHKSWYLNGHDFTFDEWLDHTTGLTAGEKVMYKLQYG